MLKRIAFSLVLGFGLASVGQGQTAEQGWLDYHVPARIGPGMPIAVRALGDSAEEQTAVSELNRSLGPMAGKDASGPGFTARAREGLGGQTVVGTLEEMRKAFPSLPIPARLPREGYWIYHNGEYGNDARLLITGADLRGVI